MTVRSADVAATDLDALYEKGITPLRGVSELLIASLVLADEQDKAIPYSHGLLDRALARALDNGAYPSWMRDYFHFVDSRVGFQCVELPEILDWAQSAQLTSVPNPSYRKTRIQVDEWYVSQILDDYGYSEDDVKRWGATLRSAIREVISEHEGVATVG